MRSYFFVYEILFICICKWCVYVSAFISAWGLSESVYFHRVISECFSIGVHVRSGPPVLSSATKWSVLAQTLSPLCNTTASVFTVGGMFGRCTNNSVITCPTTRWHCAQCLHGAVKGRDLLAPVN